MTPTRKKLKICHIITRMIVGGAQENTLLSVIGQREKGHELTLLTGPSPGPEGELLKKKNLDLPNVVVNPHLVRELSPWHDTMAFFTIKRFLEKSGFDVVHTHSSKAGIIGRAAAKAAKIPLIVHTIHGQAFHRYEKPWKNFLYKAAEKWAAKRSDKIFAVCQAMIDQALEAGIAEPSKYKVVFSGMELENFLVSVPDIELRKRLNIPDASPVVGSIARLFPLKGYEYFVPAAEIIAAEFPDVFFLVVGDGIMTEEIKAQAKRKKLNFVFAGLVPPDEIWRYCSIMDVLVHLSLREGLPRAVVQALASGKPAVGFSLDGTPEVIIPGKTGFLAEPGNAESAAKHVIKLLHDPELSDKLGENGRRLAIERFGWRKMCDILEEEYFELLSRVR